MPARCFVALSSNAAEHPKSSLLCDVIIVPSLSSIAAAVWPVSSLCLLAATVVRRESVEIFANIQETLTSLIQKAFDQLGELSVAPMITGSGGLTLAKHLEVPFVQEVISVSTALQHYAPQTDVAIELGGEDAKIIYFEGGNVEQRMNGICAGGTGSFIDQMASLIQTDASGLNEYAKNYKAIYPIAARCGVFAKTDIQLASQKTLFNLLCFQLLELKLIQRK